MNATSCCRVSLPVGVGRGVEAMQRGASGKVARETGPMLGPERPREGQNQEKASGHSGHLNIRDRSAGWPS